MIRRRLPFVFLWVIAGACSSTETSETASTSGAGAAGSGGSGSGAAGVGGSGGFDPCVNLECRKVQCDNGVKTALTGTVFAPTKDSPDPLPNIAVYIPNADVEPFSASLACDVCGQELSGSPLVVDTSAYDGTFRLEDVPVGDDVPLVIQSGRWRRQVVIPKVEACVDNALPADLTRLPRNQSEGDIPRMAVQTGRLDGIECTLAKMLDLSEITAPTGAGRVHLYRATGRDMTPPLPPASDLWSDIAVLEQYDTVLMPCTAGGDPFDVTPEGGANLAAYGDAGGRLYLTHAGGSWMRANPEPYPGLVAWNSQPDPVSPLACTIDTSFPKGKIFADWLVELGVSTVNGELSLIQPQWYADSVVPPAQRWVYSTTPATLQHFTFNTPLAAPEGQQCGRVLFSNYHVASGDDGQFPTTCPMETGLTANEKLVEYMLFDLTSCIQPDVPK